MKIILSVIFLLLSPVYPSCLSPFSEINKTFIITIDGTGGSGKGTSAVEIARMLHMMHIDSGMIFRTFTYQLIKIHPELSLDQIKEQLSHDNTRQALIKSVLESSDIRLLPDTDPERPTALISLDNQLMTNRELRSENVDIMVKYLAQYTEIQEAVHIKLARKAVMGHQVVVDGRGVGNVVYLDLAQIKLYFDASTDLSESLKIRAIRVVHREFCARKSDDELSVFKKQYGEPGSINYEKLYHDFKDKCDREIARLNTRDDMDRRIKFAPLSYDPKIMDLIITDSSPEMSMIDIIETLLKRMNSVDGMEFLKDREAILRDSIIKYFRRRINIICTKYPDPKDIPEDIRDELQRLYQKASKYQSRIMEVMDGLSLWPLAGIAA
jgi:cytidylate kinase